MRDETTRWVVVVGAGVLVGVILLGCAALIWLVVGRVTGQAGIAPARYWSNGERIYFTVSSSRATRITSDLRMGMMRSGTFTCADCHGSDGRGGRVSMMMKTFKVPDIRYEVLTSEEDDEEHGDGEEEHGHESYTDESIKRAITDGVEPDGKPLKWPMPRWSMSDGDLEDLLRFLKTLE